MAPRVGQQLSDAALAIRMVIAGNKKGAYLLTPHIRHGHALKRAFSAHPIREVPLRCLLSQNRPFLMWTAAEANQNQLLVESSPMLNILLNQETNKCGITSWVGLTQGWTVEETPPRQQIPPSRGSVGHWTGLSIKVAKTCP
jgi:hypothetical protein